MRLFTRNFRPLTRRVFGVIGVIIKYGCIAHCTFEYVADIVVCSGSSMEPTLFTNNVLLTEHISPRLQKIKRGDIIVAKSPTDPRQFVCKRVTGIAGDRVKNGFYSEIIPPGHVWLEGDNRGNSTDSRSYGPVPAGLIRSRAILRVWPPQDACLLTKPEEE
ncbi:mitochondrial inner membrane protease subunit 1 isoform X2 [Neocloeon triangulifer]|uniref:mitochondrial inner membrane protease subunit 1 isoform X2 n=1 Tax=Neocloeon triangulifer TaxID=2078957 RepID=UPI00286EC671|nr:mitochondrial inner membrane protease subunit 1 isoform X2 [Neocloeon triangulifer]